MHLVEFEGNFVSWGWQRFENTAQDSAPAPPLEMDSRVPPCWGLSPWAALHQGLSITLSRLLFHCLQKLKMHCMYRLPLPRKINSRDAFFFFFQALTGKPMQILTITTLDLSSCEIIKEGATVTLGLKSCV